MKDSRGIGFIGFVEFLGFIGLMKRKRVKSDIPWAISNTMNSMNKATKFIGLEGS